MADDSRYRYRRGDNEQGANPGAPNPGVSNSGAPSSGAPMRGIPPRSLQQRPVQGAPLVRPAAAPRPSLSTPAPQLAPRPAYGTTPRPAEPAQRSYAPPPRPPQRPLQPPAPPRPRSLQPASQPPGSLAAPPAPRLERDLPPRPVPAAAPSGDDPLAELARLMGDQDPFADFSALEPEPARPAPQVAPQVAPQAARPPAAAYDRPAPPRAAAEMPAAPAGGAVRSGYGSLARQAPPPVDFDDEYDDEDEVAPPRAPAAAAASQARPSAARYDEAAYAYSAERNDDADDYDDYDDSYDPQFVGEGYMPPHGEELFEGEPRRRRGRTALLAAAGVIALAVAGTAGVYAYNMAVGDGPVAGLSGAPPVIRADATPAKTQTPPPAPGTDVGQKLIYDRVGAPGTEKVVPREEQPVDVASAARAPTDPVPATGSIPPNPTEPKKVRTMTVRADNALASQFSSVTAYAPTQNPVPAGLPAPNPVSTVPLSGATQTASVAPPVSESGSYVVQVASQRTESDAMGSWKALQARYPNLLSGYRASVKKADLGERGIYYRAQVGPFASSDQANELCRALKAQGGDCLVNRN